MNDSAPEGWEGTVLAMKSHPDIDNPFALANWMKSQGMHPHDAYDSDKLDAAVKTYREKVSDPEPEDEDFDELLDDGTEYTYGQSRGASPESNVNLLQEEDVEPIEHVAQEADEAGAPESVLMAEGNEGSTRGHPRYGAASNEPPTPNTPGLVDSDEMMISEEHEQQTEDDEFSEVEAALKSEEVEAEAQAPTSQPNEGEAVSATGKAHGTSSGPVEDPEPEEPDEPEERKGPPVDPK